MGGVLPSGVSISGLIRDLSLALFVLLLSYVMLTNDGRAQEPPCSNCAPYTRLNLVILKEYDTPPGHFVEFVGLLRGQRGVWFIGGYDGGVGAVIGGHVKIVRLVAHADDEGGADVCPDGNLIYSDSASALVVVPLQGLPTVHPMPLFANPRGFTKITRLACEDPERVWVLQYLLDNSNNTSFVQFNLESSSLAAVNLQGHTIHSIQYGACRRPYVWLSDNFVYRLPFLPGEKPVAAGRAFPSIDGSYWTSDIDGVTHVRRDGSKHHVRFFSQYRSWTRIPSNMPVVVAPDGAAWTWLFDKICRISLNENVACISSPLPGPVGTTMAFEGDGSLWYATNGTTIIHAAIMPISFPEVNLCRR